MRCASARRWEDFSSITLAVHGTGMGDRGALDLSLERAVYADGIRFAGDDGRKRFEVISLNRPPGRLVLASDPTAPMQFGEVATIFEVPLAVMRERMPGPCELQGNTRYLLDLDSGRLRHAGSPGKMPASLAIRGWTVLRDSPLPEQGRPSTVDTLGEFQASVGEDPRPPTRAASP
jgi:hypothetical protein